MGHRCGAKDRSETFQPHGLQTVNRSTLWMYKRMHLTVVVSVSSEALEAGQEHRAV
jgi:hypothetical protein